MSLIELRDLRKVYGDEEHGVRALDGVSLDIEHGEVVSLIGASGSGKSTLLNLIGGIDAATSGGITVDGRDIARAGERQLALLRRGVIGIIFQFFNLMPTLTVIENVMLPAELAGTPERDARARAAELLESVGMTHRQTHRPHELSGGEMQRTAIARALINRPLILLADEPTGNLDSKNGHAVLQILHDLARRDGTTLLIATHDPEIARTADRVIEMKDGNVLRDSGARVTSEE